jgi:uncharacterized protein (DUF427 family)
MRDYPASIVPVNHVEPVPRRVRGFLAGETVFDTVDARYVWEWPHYPQYYVPLTDVREDLLVPEDAGPHGSLGPTRFHGLRVGDLHRPAAATLLTDPPIEALKGTVKFEWAALDAWFEEDERVFVHPRDPYARVDALRSTRRVRVELEGVLLAESSSPVLVFETGLPARYYINRTEVVWRHFEASDTVTECPYKGTAAEHWSVRIGDRVQKDVAWSYDFPTRQLLPIAGLVAFYNEHVDITVDGRRLARPTTPFSSTGA